MGSAHTAHAGAKEKLTHELRQLTIIFVYLATFFLVLRFYTKLTLAEYQVNYFAYGLSLLKALALAKIILTGEALRLGERFHLKPLALVTFYKTILFSLFAFAFEVLEHFILGWIREKTTAEVYAELLDHGWQHIVALTVVVFVAFLPFFAFRELGRVLGEGRLQEIFFQRLATGEVRSLKEGH
jgi:hypothetical protein